MKKIDNIPVVLQGTDFLCASYTDKGEEALCVYKGNPKDFYLKEVIVRIHSGCLTSEVFGMENCDCSWQLKRSIEIISNASEAILIYLPGQEGKGNGLFNKIRSFELMNVGLSSEDAYEIIGLPSDKREFDFAIQILKEFGVKRIKLITNSPAKIIACIDGGIEVSERIPIVIDNPNAAVRQLLDNKKNHFNHLIN